MPPDLEPASALFARLQSMTLSEAHWAIEADRAAVREPLERQVRELEGLAYVGDHHFPDLTYKARLEELVPKFRERSERLALLERRIVELVEARAVLETENEELGERAESAEGKLAEAEERIASLEAQLASARAGLEMLIDACDAAADCYTATGLLEAANTAREKLLTSPPKSPSLGTCKWVKTSERQPTTVDTYRTTCVRGATVAERHLQWGKYCGWVCTGEDPTHWLEVTLPELPPPADRKEPHGR